MQNAHGTGMGSPPGESAGNAQGVKQQVGNVVSDVKSGASALMDGAKAQAVGAVEQRKTTAAESLGTVAEALRGAANTLGEGQTAPLRAYADSAAEQVDKAARYLRDKDVQTLARDTETFARRHPEVFLGGAFLAGILAARFLKSTGQRSAGDGQGGQGTQPGWQGWDTARIPGSGAGYGAGSGADYGAGYGSAGGTGYTGAQESFNPPHLDTNPER